ncbi:hypothetical protein A374_15062 [Fictibacillus macauensis ZFHKF-1]|uniref:Uncharacterized protein n=1 Tax=Fictibacillus macauensis ZFHKF-1 TaxID=1196324 RepID=I8IYC8_9BACL|nr:hypothetical protein A374_15062 [Fictibacillus macauensis ZFHKF-1]
MKQLVTAKSVIHVDETYAESLNVPTRNLVNQTLITGYAIAYPAKGLLLPFSKVPYQEAELY